MINVDKEYYYGTGRRKSSVARVFMKPGTGKVSVNGRVLKDYFCNETSRMLILQPIELVDMIDKMDVKATVKGGGTTGQAGAIRLGIARALLQYGEETEDEEDEGGGGGEGEGSGKITFRRLLRSKGFLTRDARKVERKKAGFRKARKSVQYSKR